MVVRRLPHRIGGHPDVLFSLRYEDDTRLAHQLGEDLPPVPNGTRGPAPSRSTRTAPSPAPRSTDNNLSRATVTKSSFPLTQTGSGPLSVIR